MFLHLFVGDLFCNYFDVEERADCFTLIVFMKLCDSKCSVALPHGAVGWYVVCSSLSYSLTVW